MTWNFCSLYQTSKYLVTGKNILKHISWKSNRFSLQKNFKFIPKLIEWLDTAKALSDVIYDSSFDRNNLNYSGNILSDNYLVGFYQNLEAVLW